MIAEKSISHLFIIFIGCKVCFSNYTILKCYNRYKQTSQKMRKEITVDEVNALKAFDLNVEGEQLKRLSIQVKIRVKGDKFLKFTKKMQKITKIKVMNFRAPIFIAFSGQAISALYDLSLELIGQQEAVK
ncbi:hypothetical protein [Pseudomonas sp. FSL W5-0203]|nr:hypothetical protein [Pseudomonas sp. FSL W5-0203]